MPRRAHATAVSIEQSLAVAPERLRWRCAPETLGFTSTSDVPQLEGTVGQPRGLEAIALSLAIEGDGFNVYVAGPPGTGRTSTVQRMLADAARRRPTSGDWCYLHNFDNPNQPVAVQLSSGRGPVLARDLDEFIQDCRREIPRVFEGEQYRKRRALLADELQTQRQALFEQVRAHAQRLGFEVEFSPMGVTTVPLLEPGKPLSPEAFDLLTEDKKAEFRIGGQQLARLTEEVLVEVRRVEREAHERLHALDHEAVNYAVGHLLDVFRTRYSDVPAVTLHLDRIQADLVAHLDEFRASEHEPGPGDATIVQSEHDFSRYRANVLATHEPDSGAPIVSEPNPTYYNLLGKLDYRAAMGAMYTDVGLIRAGALHHANGGYLVLQARDVLVSPFAWEALKRALRDQEIRIENLGEQFSSFPTATLKPAPIPLRVRVVMIGDLRTYMLLLELDPDFARLFKIKAQFGEHMDRSPEAIRAYAEFVSGQVHARGLCAFGADAVAEVLEYGARRAEHQDRLIARFELIEDLLVEADHYARAEEAERVAARHVRAALVARERRVNLYEELVQREIEEGTIAIDTHASVAAQVNGLSVSDLGDHAFARPSRITARIGPGDEGVVDIEREVKLSGPTHSKGVLILSGYLLEQYAKTAPLALSARLTFEQVYGEIDGDSASSAELYALLSGLAGAPIRQGIAVTGSVNQRGEVQAVGAVTTKIEGFFAVCKAQGLDGQQGVIVPATNVRHLMLKQEIVDAVAAGDFHVWAVRSVDEGIALLTGLDAGDRQADGTFPPGTLHARVQQRLEELGTRLIEFRRPASRRTRTPHLNGRTTQPSSAMPLP